MVRSEFNFDFLFVIYRIFFQSMLHVADVINFVFFCMHALQLAVFNDILLFCR
jgi:hypothetical protein